MTTRNPPSSPPPPEALAMLAEHAACEEVVLPYEPAREQIAYLYPYCGDLNPEVGLNWLNAPDRDVVVGNGCGFGNLTERPRLLQPCKPPARLFHFWLRPSWWYVASPDVLELLQPYRDCIETIPIEWTFSDGRQLDGYVFLDITALVDAYDYRRSQVFSGSTTERIGVGRYALRRDLPEDLHIFRDAHHRTPFVSRALAQQLSAYTRGEVAFIEGFGRIGVRFEPSGEPRPVKAQLSPPPSVPPPPTWARVPSLSEKVDLLMISLFDSGDLVGAEQLLVGWLQELPSNASQSLVSRQITTPPQRVAEYLDTVFTKASSEHELIAVEVVYDDCDEGLECHAFGVSGPGDLEAYRFDGGDSFDSPVVSDEPLVIAGLKGFSLASLSRDMPAAGKLATAVVVVRFCRLVAASIACTKHLRCPLLITTPEYSEFVVRLDPPQLQG